MKKISIQINKQHNITRFEFKGKVTVDMMHQWFITLKRAVVTFKGADWKVICIMSTPLDPECKEILGKAQNWAKDNNLIRSAVVAPPIQARMMRLIGENTKVGETEKYFRSDENYKESLMKWLVDGIYDNKGIYK